MSKINQIEGKAVPVEGNDIDTDRIIPARYLKEITFTNMGQYPFYDERFDAEGKPKGHPFDLPQFQGAHHSFREPELRLRLLPGARSPGAHALGHPGHHRRILCGDFRGQLHHAGHPDGHRQPGRDAKTPGPGEGKTETRFKLDLDKKVLFSEGKEHLKVRDPRVQAQRPGQRHLGFHGFALGQRR